MSLVLTALAAPLNQPHAGDPAATAAQAKPAETAPAEAQASEPTDVDAMLAERTLGNPDAPVTLVEYSSLTCPHCASFHRATLPQIKQRYVDTDQVRIVYHDFPLDPFALAGAMIARCVSSEDGPYFDFLETLFAEQDEWARAEQPRDALQALAADAGLDEPAFNACLANGPLLAGIRSRTLEAAESLNIQSTPTFFVNGERVSGARPFSDFQTIIERKLKEAEQASAVDAPATVASARAVVPAD